MRRGHSPRVIHKKRVDRHSALKTSNVLGEALVRMGQRASAARGGAEASSEAGLPSFAQGCSYRPGAAFDPKGTPTRCYGSLVSRKRPIGRGGRAVPETHRGKDRVVRQGLLGAAGQRTRANGRQRISKRSCHRKRCTV